MKISAKFLIILAVLSTVAAGHNAFAKTIAVTSTADDGPGSLRQALVTASNGDKINITAKGTITLTSGELIVNKSVTISGPGAHGTVSGNGTSRVFHITPGTTVTVNSLTIINGSASQDINDFPANAGGGIYSDHAKLTVNNCTVSGNSASLGGAIFSNSMDGGSASLTINNTTISNNSASFAGGGVFSGGGFYYGVPSGSATVVVSNSAITNNSALPYGGGIFTDGFGGNASLTLTRSVVNGNSARFGAGIYNNGDSGVSAVTLTNTTLSGNAAHNDFDPRPGIGGAIFNDGSASLSPGNAMLVATDSSISNNTSDLGGSIHNEGSGGNATLNNCSIRDNQGTGIQNFAVATIRNCTVSGNSGGGIHNAGPATLTLINSAVTNNSGADPVGGGVTNAGATLVVTGSTISGNSTDDSGGGIRCDGGNVAIFDSTISGNSAASVGGGMYINESGTVVTLNNSTLSGNLAGDSGAIFSESHEGGDVSVTLTNCTVSNNSNTFAGGGFNPISGGIFNGAAGGSATLTLNNCTFSGNFGWGVLNYRFDPDSTATVEIANTIFNAGPSSGTIASVQGNVISHGYNLSSDAAFAGDNVAGPGSLLNGPGDIRNTNPMLGPLQNNGGPTLTQALLKNSPAINAGDPNFNPYLFNPPLFYDQRGPGFPRVVKGRLDIGAYEAKP